MRCDMSAYVHDRRVHGRKWTPKSFFRDSKSHMGCERTNTNISASSMQLLVVREHKDIYAT